MSNDLRNLREFEEGAWRQLNSKSENEPFPADLHNRITAAWSRLAGRNRAIVAAAADEFLTQQAEYNKAKAWVVTASRYKGSVNDDDAYGQETGRPEFSQYGACKTNLLKVLQTLYDATQKLRQQRRVLGLPSDDYGATILDMLSQHYEQIIPSCQSEIDNLPIEREAAKTRLSERQRIAEGGLGPSWVGKWVLGQGSFGKAVLFVNQDSARQVTDHVVVKDSMYAAYPDMWNLKELWSGWKGPEDLSSVPNEIQAMYNLSGQDGSENIIKIRNWRIRRDDMYHRIYMEFCPRGDLFDFCCGSKNDLYWDGADRRERFPDDDMGNFVELVPEPFLWSVFRSLTNAAILMERGTRFAAEANKDWEVIVHRDLKLSNVFASWPSRQRFKGYPEIKVADFGLCLMMPPDNDKVAEDYTSQGTAGNKAPEHVRFLPAGDGTTKMVSSKTNVWNVGLILFSLITCNEGLLDPYIEWETDESKVMPELDATARVYYSDELISLVYRCLRFNDEERPTPDEVMNEIMALTCDAEFDLSSGLTDAPVGDPRWHTNRLHWEESKWKANMALQDAPRPAGDGPWPPAPPPPNSNLPSTDFGGATGMEILTPK